LGGAPRAHQTLDLSTFVRTLTLTGGKGGVGKTTVSCALALAAAAALNGSGRVLLVSTDPAPSIADALDQPIEDGERAVAEAPGLFARQMDAGAAFRAFRERYQERIDVLFDGLIGRGVDASHDRGILRELLALAPPGIDELHALASLGDTLEGGEYARIVVDPAPTGHLLRLLEMPALALDWSHRVMRMMLKYKEVAGLGDSAQELLAFARRTRAIEALLHDPERAGLIVVTLNEPLVRAESARLVRALRGAGVAVHGIAWNRAESSDVCPPSPLPTDVPLPQLVAPLALSPPIGVLAIRAWSERWYALPPGDS
jgi:arsenite-transporting ATPase